jgi:hypothetical protein
MSKIARFVIWICSKFTRIEIEQIIAGLLDVLNNRNPEEALAKVIKWWYFLRFIRLLFCYNFVQSKTNRRRANEPQRHDIMAEDENTSGFISACGGMCE